MYGMVGAIIAGLGIAGVRRGGLGRGVIVTAMVRLGPTLPGQCSASFSLPWGWKI